MKRPCLRRLEAAGLPEDRRLRNLGVECSCITWGVPMDSLVKSRPNHYELLGLTPAATDEDIRRAFAREISPLRPRPFGSLAQLGVAHETLRDPVKRRAYDISIGLPEPAKPAPLAGWQYSGPVRVSRLSQAAADSQVATEPK